MRKYFRRVCVCGLCGKKDGSVKVENLFLTIKYYVTSFYKVLVDVT